MVGTEFTVAGSASPAETDAFLALGVELAKKAGAMIREGFNQPRGEYDRKSATDPVTETDRAVEAFVFTELRKVYPSHQFIGEESASEEAWTDAPTWIVDPIDGTANFVHRLPHVCVSIGLTIKKRCIVGVVYNPIMDELFTATHDGPSLLNGTPICVSNVSDLSSACIASEYGSNRNPEKVTFMVANTGNLLRNNVMCLRAFGSCALDMCYVACGRLDGYCEHGPYAWDLAAGALIIERAGGVIKNAVGRPLSLTGRSLLACTPGIEHQILEILIPRPDTAVPQ